MVLGLAKGQPVVVTGERADLSGVIASEAVILSDIVHSDGLTTLFFASDLVNTYVRASATSTPTSPGRPTVRPSTRSSEAATRAGPTSVSP